MRILSVLISLTWLALLHCEAAESSFETCRRISDDQTRLRCLKDLIAAETKSGAPVTDDDSGWPLLRTPSPGGNPDIISIMRTPDTMRSDPDFAGLMVKCADGDGLEVLLALVRPLPPRTKIKVLLDAANTHMNIESESATTGTALLLSPEVAASASKIWQRADDLAVTIKSPDAEIRGHVLLNGFEQALQKLKANCRLR